MEPFRSHHQLLHDHANHSEATTYCAMGLPCPAGAGFPAVATVILHVIVCAERRDTHMLESCGILACGAALHKIDVVHRAAGAPRVEGFPDAERTEVWRHGAGIILQ